MNTQIRRQGKTYTTQSFPWGLYARNGHRLLCADGKIRAASMAPTADTFFSIPASIRLNGQTVSGYACCEEDSQGRYVMAFRHHTAHADKLPPWPSKYTPEHDILIASAL